MSIRFKCACGKSYKVDDKFAGKRTKCTACGAAIQIPKPAKSESDSTFELAAEPPAPKPPPAAVPPMPVVPPMPPVPPPAAQPAAPKGGELLLEVEPTLPKAQAPQMAEGLELSVEEPPTKPALQGGAEPPVLSEAPHAVQAPAGGEEIPVGAPEPPPPAEKKCPKCGASADPSAAICIECGANFSATVKPAVRKEPGIAGFLKRNAAMVAIAGVGLVLLGGFIFGVAYLMKSRRAKQSPPVSAAPGPQTPAPGPGATPQPGAPGLPPGAPPGAGPRPGMPPEPVPAAPQPVAKVDWKGFKDPRLVARDKLAAAGSALIAAITQSGKPPAAATEIGLPADALAGISYVGPEVAGLARFRPLLYESAESSGKRYVYFSDGSTHLLTGSEWTAALPVKMPQGYLTPADQELLAATAPRLRITNERFANVEAQLDGVKVATVPKGQSRSLEMTEGAHKLTLTASDGKSETLPLTAARGLDCAYLLPLHVDTIFVPVRAYRALLAQQGGNMGYAPEKDGNTLIALKGQFERVVFSTPGARGALSPDLRTLEARIEREFGTIEGIDGKTLRVDEFSRLEEGIVTFKSGAQATYRHSALGTLATVVSPNLAAAASAQLALPSSFAGTGASSDMMRMGGIPPGAPRSGAIPGGMPPGMMPPTRGGARPGERPDFRAPPGMPPGMTQPGMFGQSDKQFAEKLIYPREGFSTTADLSVVAPAFSSGAAAKLILARALGLQKEAALPTAMEGAPLFPETAGNPMGGRPPVGPGTTRMPPPGGGAAPGMPGATPGAERPAQAPALFLLTSSQEAIARASSEGALFAGLTLYGGADSFAAMLPLAEQLQPGAPGANEMLLALARCGQGAALAQLAAAAQQSPVAASIALSLIDDEAARKACGAVMADWTAERVQEAVSAWPKIAGPVARRNFILSLAAAKPDLLDDVATLNALMKLDSSALQPVLVKRLPDVQNPAEQPAAERPAGMEGTPAPSYAPGGRAGQGEKSDAATPPGWLLLAHVRNSQAVARLVALLYGADAKVKLQAISALAEASDDSLVGPLGAQLSETDATVRLEAARALARIGSAEAVALLTEQMTADFVSEEIVEAAPDMIQHAGREATGRLLTAMLKLVVSKPQEPAGEPGAPGMPGAPMPGRPPMPEGMPLPPPGAGRPAGGPPAMPRAARSPGFPPGMGQAETSAPAPIAKRILDAMSQLGVPAGAKPLIEQATKDADPAVRFAAFRALAMPPGSALRGIGKLLMLRGPSQAFLTAADVAPLMKDEAPTLRADAIRVLGGGASAEACEILLAAAKDADAGVRLAAMQTALRLSGASPKLNDAIAAGLADTDPEVVAAAAEAALDRKLAALGEPVVAALNRPMQEGMEETQAQALIALTRAAARLKAPGATSALILLLAHKEPAVKSAAALALGELRDAAAVPSLVSASRSEEPDLAGTAVIALSGFDSSSAAQAILAALQKETLPEEARRTVLMRVVAAAGKPGPFADWAASGQFGPADMLVFASIAAGAPDALKPGLIAIARRGLQDQRPEVRLPAISILGRFNSDPAVRTAIVAALEQDASGVAVLAADIIRQNKDPALLTNQMMRLYKQLADAAPQISAAGPMGGAGGVPGDEMGARTGTSPAGGAPGAATAAAPAARGGGLARASLEENMLLRQAVIDSVFNCFSGEEAARTLRSILATERSDVMRCRLIDALARTGDPIAVGYVADLAARGGNVVAPYAVQTLARIGALNRTAAEETLQRLSKASAADPEIAAAAQDALDALAAI